MERCKNCGAALFGDEDGKCDFCGNDVKRKNYNPESYNKERFEENFNEYHETIDCDCEKPGVGSKDGFFSNNSEGKPVRKHDKDLIMLIIFLIVFMLPAIFLVLFRMLFKLF